MRPGSDATDQFWDEFFASEYFWKNNMPGQHGTPLTDITGTDITGTGSDSEHLVSAHTRVCVCVCVCVCVHVYV